MRQPKKEKTKTAKDLLLYGVRSSRRVDAVRALGESKDPRALEALLLALVDELGVVREAAAEAILLRTSPGDLSSLFALLQKELGSVVGRSSEVERRVFRIGVLVDLFVARKEEGLVALLREALSTEKLREIAGEALLRFQTKDSQEVLFAALQSDAFPEDSFLIEAVLRLPPREAYEKLSPYFDAERVFRSKEAFQFFTRLMELFGKEPSEGEPDYRAHLREEPRWCALLPLFEGALSRSPHSYSAAKQIQDFVKVLGRVCEPSVLYEGVSSCFGERLLSSDWRARALGVMITKALYELLMEAPQGTLSLDPRWLERYLTVQLFYSSDSSLEGPPIGPLLARLAVPPSVAFDCFSGPLKSRNKAEQILALVKNRPTLCEDERWPPLLQELRRDPALSALAEEILALRSALGTHGRLPTAESPTAQPEHLQVLSTDTDKEARRRVVQNPNTPLPALVPLAAEFPKEFVENPALSLFFLEDANFLARIQRETPSFYQAIEALLSLDSLPGWLFGAIWRLWLLPALRVRALQHRICPAEILGEYLYHKEPSLRLAAARNPNAPKDLIKTLRALGSDAKLERHHPEKVDLTLSAAFLEGFAAHGYWAKYLVARHPKASTALLEKLAEDPDEEIRAGVAQNPKTPPAVLTSLASKDNNRIQFNVAGNPSTPEDVLLTLAKSSQRTIQVAVAENPSATAKVLLFLAKDSDPEPDVKLAIASHPSASAEALLLLARFDNHRVRRQVVQNENTPTEALLVLSRTGGIDIFRAACKHPNAPKELRDFLKD